MPGSVTFWNRLEPRPRTESVAEPLAARVRDPLWMLTRQWQLGEFRGEDTGSPAWVELMARLGRMTEWRAGSAPSRPLVSAPLEGQAESEPLTPDLATAIELGQTFESLLLAEGADPDLVSAFRDAYPIAATPTDPTDPAEAAYRRVCAGRATDGLALLEAARPAQPGLPPDPPVPAPQQGPAAAALAALIRWSDDTFGRFGTTDPVAWRPARLEYALDVAVTSTAGGAVLAGTPGSDGMLDWAAFDVRPARGAGRDAQPASTTLVPTHVRFRGMPNARFWDFESGTSDLGALQPDRRDLARLALVDFMLVHSNDWFMLPVELPVGSTYQIDHLLVRDVFGVLTLVARADREPTFGGRWSMFGTSVAGTAAASADFFLLPSSARAAVQQGGPVEEVRFARDEMANMVWALENLTENQVGEPWSGHERDLAHNGGTIPESVDAGLAVPLRYLLQTRVPEHWIPLLPVSLDPGRGIVTLELAAMLRPDPPHEPIAPQGRILRPLGQDPYRIQEEEVPRNGVRVQRVVCRARWVDGSTHLWQMRRKQPGTGEANSALRFDVAAPNAAD